ncbi:MAG TPA: Hpt domain-containing protein [Methylibium sp.]|uniref:Hpt domain-containing protein n=1 Tax=Methylibium sp. TaxID=2067992 RepID=UPI002DBB24CB|nr:Hpt domain-containing protein [Methylibium sp.]HEU4457952.1 Hpt domain-containing protein [Methylibium sp.]
MDSLPSQPLSDIRDDSALAWVQEELRKSLELAHKSLRRTLKEREAAAGSDLDDVEATPLRTARQQLHQAVGVLELVNLRGGAALLRGSEAAVQRFIAKPAKLDMAAIDTIERASFALHDFLTRRIAGHPVSPLALFPQYRAVHELAGTERIHPADLWDFEWQWSSLAPRSGDAPTARAADADALTAFEKDVLASMRGGGAEPLRRLGELSAELSAGVATGPGGAQLGSLWQLAAGFFEGQAQGLLPSDVYAKRVASRLLAQLRQQSRGDATASERLARELLFFCARSGRPSAGAAPQLDRIHAAWPTVRDEVAIDYSTVQLGRHDPAWITQARKRVAAAKDSWSAVAGGEMHRLGNLNEQFSLVRDSLERLVPGGEVLGEAMAAAVGATVQAGQNGQVPEPALAMEVATSLLYLEAALEEGAFDQPEQAARVHRLAQRVGAVRGAAQPEALETWMEELYRRVSDRQTMGSVVQELRSSLSESEKLIDQFFRSPDDPSVLIPVPAQLQAMRGVLSVLGLDAATHAVLRMRDDVDALVAAGAQARHEQPLFERLAGNLSAMSFLIDLLGVQPQTVKALFRYDEASGLLRSRMGRANSALEAAAAPRLDPELIAQAQALAAAVADPATPAEQVSRDLERFARDPGVLAQPALVANLDAARSALEQAAAPGMGNAARAFAREHASEMLADFAATGAEPVGLPPLDDVPAIAPISLAPAAAPLVDLETDDEMREVFLEEAREVVAEAGAALDALAEVPQAVDQLTTVRRAFHTLKGSSRMVGLAEFGEAAWACEQLYNDLLARQHGATPDVLAASQDVVAHLARWVEAVAGGADAGWSAAPVRAVADALRLEGRRIALPGAPTQPGAAGAASLASPAAAAESLSEPAAAAVALREPDATVAFGFDPADATPAASFDTDATLPLADVLPPGIELPEATELDLALPAAQAMPLIDAEPPADAAPSAAGLDFEFRLDIDEPAAPQPALPEVEPLESPPPSFESTAFDNPDLDATMPLPLPQTEVLPLPPGTDFSTIDLDLPGAFAESTAPAKPLIETLLPSRGLPPAEPAWAGTGHGPESATVPFEPSELIEALQPSVAGELGASAEPAPLADDQVKVIGSLSIGIPLFNIFLAEADELSRRLGVELSEWSHELQRPVGETAVALAHSLGGSSATVGFIELSALARKLEAALAHSQRLGHGVPADAQLFLDTSEEVRRLLHQFAAGFLKSPTPELLAALDAFEADIAERLEDAITTQGGAEGFAASAQAAWAADGPPAEATGESAEPATRAVAVEPEAAAESAAADFDAPHLRTDFADLGVADFRPLAPAPRLDETPRPPSSREALDGEEDLDAVDAVDAELFPIFEEEAQELLPQLAAELRDWSKAPAQQAHAAAAMRTLHTLKGGARLAGAMRLGEMSHRLETAIEHLMAESPADGGRVEQLLGRADALAIAFEALRQRDAQAYDERQSGFDRLTQPGRLAALDTSPATLPQPLDDAGALLAPLPALSDVPPAAAEPARAEPPLLSEIVEELPFDAPPAAPALPPIDWSRFAAGDGAPALPTPTERAPLATAAAVRVRTQLLDRMVNQAGEVSIARARLESEVGQIRGSLGDLTDNLERLRGQLRDIELQAETQMATRMEAAKAAAQAFDPLEFDRFTRFQELTRMMAESVNDVATVQRSLQRTLETAEDGLAAQARLTRDLQEDLLRTRMVEFEGLSERLYRVVRQAAKETGKQVRLDIIGGSIEVDRGVLDRMTGAFEHLLRNCITHGIEPAERRLAAGKEATGHIVVSLRQEGNEVSVEFRDDGGGLDLARIRDKGRSMGLVAEDANPSDAELANLIFMPGFTTADKVTELAGRGVGMDVVRAEVNALGGRIETASASGQGTSFTLVLPLTTAVTQVVMLRAGATSVAVPATLVEIVRRASAAEIEHAYQTGAYSYGEQTLPLLWLGALLQASARSVEPTGRSTPVIVVRSAQQRIALHVDEVLGNQEVVVKNLGPQMSSLPGLAGMTLLASGAVALIYNPVALATVYGEAARRTTAAAPALRDAPAAPVKSALAAATAAPLVLVVDDSLTVRRVTQRLLVREGYRVAVAKDGLEAIERLTEEKPAVVLSDIEMPRMDGFDLVRQIRADRDLVGLPVIMITSRIAQKHRDYAAQLGVNHYLGKPYSEEELLSLIGRYCRQAQQLQAVAA